DFRLLGGFIDRLAERGKLRRGDDDSRWVGCNGLFEDADLADYVGFGLCAQFDHVYAEVLTGIARASQYGLPIERGRILHDDRNRRFRLRHRGRTKGKAGEDDRSNHIFLHDHAPKQRPLGPQVRSESPTGLALSPVFRGSANAVSASQRFLKLGAASPTLGSSAVG